MTQEPTPTPDDETQLVYDVMNTLDGALHHDIDCRDVKAILDALKTLGYELVNQVGTVHESPESWQHIVDGPTTAPTATDNQVINPSTVELTARWIGERESTHTWPEIREDDKACYRDAARHLLATIRFGLADAAMSLGPGERNAAAAALRADDAARKVSIAEANLAAARAGQEAGKEFATAIQPGPPGPAAPKWIRDLIDSARLYPLNMLLPDDVVAVQLPEPRDDRETPTWSTLVWRVQIVNNIIGGPSISLEVNGGLLNPADGQPLAAALLAAAAKVEAGE